MVYQMPIVFPPNKNNKIIGFLQGERQSFSMFASNVIPNLAFFSLDYGQCLPMYRFSKLGERTDNITDWALEQFQNHYQQAEPSSPVCYANSSELRDEFKLDLPDNSITKESIFHYVYAVLHNPAYRKKYELNLKREFPRIPFYKNFWRWAAWGKSLMNLHINYETATPYHLERKEVAAKEVPKAKLKAIKESGIIVLDDNTELHGIPKQAWDYKLGNRSALEWILDQYKEKKPSDPTIAEKFNTYKFADYKEQVIDLLERVCTVSVETMKIVKEMEEVSGKQTSSV
jgi:predicted helicase